MAEVETLTTPAPSIRSSTKVTVTKKSKSKLRNPPLSEGRLVYTIDASCPVDNSIFDISALEQYLHSKFKVNGSAGNKADKVEITHDGHTITVSASVHFPKRYLKYLIKKFLKKEQLRDWFKVIAITKTSYSIRAFNIQGDEEKND